MNQMVKVKDYDYTLWTSINIDPDNEEVKNALRNIYYKLGEGKKLEALDRK